MQIASFLLSLPEVQNSGAVRVMAIICVGHRLDAIVLLAEVKPQDPPAATCLTLSISDV